MGLYLLICSCIKLMPPLSFSPLSVLPPSPPSSLPSPTLHTHTHIFKANAEIEAPEAVSPLLVKVDGALPKSHNSVVCARLGSKWEGAWSTACARESPHVLGAVGAGDSNTDSISNLEQYALCSRYLSQILNSQSQGTLSFPLRFCGRQQDASFGDSMPLT